MRAGKKEKKSMINSLRKKMYSNDVNLKLVEMKEVMKNFLKIEGSNNEKRQRKDCEVKKTEQK